MTKLRLLDKRELDRIKSIERRQEIDEGLKLAKRIDSLRETRADEEASLEKYREQTLSQLHEEILAKDTELKALTTEVDQLEQRRKAAKKPLDDELAALEEARSALDGQRQEQDNRESVLRHTEAKLIDEGRMVTAIRNDIEKRTVNITRLHDDAEHDRNKAAVVLGEAETVREDTKRFREGVIKELVLRDAEVAARERDLGVRKDSVDKRESELDEREIRLKDREETLARNLTRYGRRT